MTRKKSDAKDLPLYNGAMVEVVKAILDMATEARYPAILFRDAITEILDVIKALEKEKHGKNAERIADEARVEVELFLQNHLEGKEEGMAEPNNSHPTYIQ